MNLAQSILNQLNAGTLLTVVIEPDEVLAMQAIREAADAVAKGNVQVARVLAPAPGIIKILGDFLEQGRGVMVVSDLLRTLGNNPMLPRMLREIALQVKDNPVRLILLESPGVEIPALLKGDVEPIYTQLPTVEELKKELEQFLAETKIKLEGNGEVRAAIANAGAGLARHQFSKLLGRCWTENKKLDAKWLRTAKSKTIQEQSGKVLSFVDVDEAADLGGAEVMQEWLTVAQASFTSDAAKAFGLPEPKGLCLVGVPGTGKSLTPKNIARKWGFPLIRLDIGAIFGGIVGATEANMRAALEAIEACAPCILWIDEAEKALGGKGGSQGDSGVSTRLTGALLTWMQENKKPVFMVATANSVEDLRPELLRKGRIDDTFFLDLPDFEERCSIAAIHIKLKTMAGNGVADLVAKDIADLTDKFSGSEIEQLIIQAMRKAFVDAKRKVTADDVRLAAEGTTPLAVMKAKDVQATRDWAKDNRAIYANRKAQAKAAEGKGGRRLNLGGEGEFPAFEAK